MIQKIKEDTELLQENMTKKIVELNDGIDLNNKKEREILKEINEVTNKVVIMENKIKKRKEELKAMGVEYKNNMNNELQLNYNNYKLDLNNIINKNEIKLRKNLYEKNIKKIYNKYKIIIEKNNLIYKNKIENRRKI